MVDNDSKDNLTDKFQDKINILDTIIYDINMVV
jgi:hypothetical protein